MNGFSDNQGIFPQKCKRVLLGAARILSHHSFVHFSSSLFSRYLLIVFILKFCRSQRTKNYQIQRISCRAGLCIGLFLSISNCMSVLPASTAVLQGNASYSCFWKRFSVFVSSDVSFFSFLRATIDSTSRYWSQRVGSKLESFNCRRLQSIVK